MKQVFQIKEPSKLLMHILAWAVIFLLPYIFTAEYYSESETNDSDRSDFLYLDTVTKIFWVCLFYLNTSILIPRLVYRKKIVLFVCLQVLLFSIIMSLHGLLFQWMINDHTFHFLPSSSHNIIPFLFTVIVSVAYKTVSDKAQTDAIASEKQQENLKTELSFLRSQISPHFLFNVLNNMVAMVRMKSEALEPTILKLSSMMQYMLYETNEEKVMVQSEVEYLQSYIDLQLQRFGKNLTVQVYFDIKENWHSMEPMLLIPFVENAFKHGMGMVENPEIDINLSVENGALDFRVRNKYQVNDHVKDKTAGIGLNNVKRRLELLYADNCNLEMHSDGNWFNISLHITLKT